MKLATLAASALILAPAAAAACGGFFCAQVPVDQSGENIVFAVHEDGTTEAHVQVFYQGAAEDFAWIVPTPAEPEVGVSTDVLFTTLDSVFGVRWAPTWEYQNCEFGPGTGEQDASFDNAGAGPPAADPADDGVTVVQQSSVGPYDFAVLQATDVEPLFEWLGRHNYDIPDETAPMVEPYVVMGGDIHFVAFRLSKERDVGDLQPIRLTYESAKPSVPIRLTAIAAMPDMGVRVHVIGESRSVPENYLHVHVNEAAIDWLGGGWNYPDLVTAAMDEAGGQGFTTEYAGPSAPMHEMLYREGQFDMEGLAEIDDPVEFFDEMRRQGFQASGQLMGLLQAFIPLPEGWEERGLQARDFYNCLSCYADEIDRDSFDPVAFAMALGDAIVAPLQHAQTLFDGDRTVTRLFTTLSAEEMTNDPVFAFNPSMDDVSNVRTAEIIWDCEARTYVVRLEDGRSIVGSTDFGFDAADGMPAAMAIEETGASGAPVVVEDNGDEIDTVLTARSEAFDAPTSLSQPERTWGGCTAAGYTGAGGWLTLMLGLAARRRRR